MILGQLKTNNYSTNNIVSHGKMRIANNSVMQSILSEFLYSDKIKSVIQEICTNAFEAHFEAGYPNKPFNINLPTKENPQLVIRDYGKGLNRDQLENVYTVYGVSTKRTNEYTAGFGLGCKSPLCITGNFTVISICNGIKYVVTIGEDSKGNYCFDILSETEADEQSGLEVIIDVDKTQIVDFKPKAEKVLKWFPTAPTCNLTLNLKKPEVKERGDKWEITNYNKSYYDGNKSLLICGVVAYPIDSTQFSGRYKLILDTCDLILYAEIGSVSILPSREGLGYTKPTIEKIQSILDDLYNTVDRRVSKEISSCKCLWDARLVSKKYFSNNNFASKVLGDKFKYNGKEFSALRYNVKTSINPLLGKFQYDSHTRNARHQRKNLDIEVWDNVEFALYEKGGYEATRRYILDNIDKTVYVCDEKYKDILTDEVGLLEKNILKTSNFPAAIRQSRGKSSGNKIRAYKFEVVKHLNTWSNSYYYESFDRKYWKEESIDLDSESGYYCPIYSFKINGVAARLLAPYVNKENIIGVLSAREKKVAAHSNWKHIKYFLKEKLDKTADKYIYELKNYSSELDNMLSCKEKFKDNVDLYNKLCLLENYRKNKEKIDEFINLKKTYEDISNEKYDAKIKTLDLGFNFTKKYPLLSYINRGQWNHTDVVHYILSVDAGKL